MGMSNLTTEDIESFLVKAEILSADLAEILANVGKFVPYTGATSNVDLGTHNFITTGTLGAGAATVTNLTDSGLTITRIPYASTAGLLIDNANLTYDGTTFSIGTAAGTGANKFFIRGSSYPVSLTERYYADGYNTASNVGIFSAYSGRNDTTSGWGPTMTFICNDSTASECSLGQLGFVRDTAAPTYRGKFVVNLSGTGGSYSEAFTIGHTGIITITPREADYDSIINFTGTTNSGQFSWMEDEDYFQFADDILMTTAENIYFRDTALSINSDADGYLDIKADTGIRLNNKIKTYNNIATEDYGVPAIVDGVALTNQNASIGATNFTNAGTAGLYEVDWYLECTTADPAAGVVTATIGWTDDTATGASAGSAALTLTNKGRNWTRCYCQLASGNITYSTTVGGAAGNSKYALYATCKRLA